MCAFPSVCVCVCVCVCVRVCVCSMYVNIRKHNVHLIGANLCKPQLQNNLNSSNKVNIYVSDIYTVQEYKQF